MEIARAQERAEFVPLIGLIQLIQNPETGIAGVRGDFVLDVKTAIIEEILHKTDRLQVRCREFIHVHRFLVEITRVEEFDAEGEIFHPPQSLIAAETDLPIFIVIEVVLSQDRRQVGTRRMKRAVRPFLGPLDDVVHVHLAGFRTRRNPSRQGQDDCEYQATASPHFG